MTNTEIRNLERKLSSLKKENAERTQSLEKTKLNS